MDQRLSPDALLQHADFTRSLARHLLRDPADADDAAQETWRVAIERPPRPEGSVRGWFATVLRNTIRQSRRTRSRRGRRERQGARPERLPSALDSVVERETLQRVVGAVDALAEPYRTTILLRYYEDLPPRVIAVRMGAPVETVKSRLKRARQQLRQRLESGRVDWRLALAPLVGAPASSGAAATAVGASLMSTKLKVSLGVAAIALLGFAAWHLFTDAPDDSLTTVADAEDALGADGDAHDPGGALRANGRTETQAPEAPREAVKRAGREALLPPQGARSSAPVARAKKQVRGRGVINGLVTLAGQPVTSGTVQRRGHAKELPPDPIPIAADGTFEISGLLNGREHLTVRVGDLQPRSIGVSVTQGEAKRVTVAFGTAVLWGVVHDELGRPAAGVPVRMSSFHRATEDGFVSSAEGDAFGVSVRTTLGGRYKFRDLPAGTYAMVATVVPDSPTDARNIRSQQVTLTAGETRRFDIGGAREDPYWTGTVQYADGERVRRRGNIFLRNHDGEQRMYVNFDADGRFSEAVPVGTYDVELVMHPMHTAFAGARILKAGTLEITPQGSIESVIFPGARVAGRVNGHKPRTGQLVTLRRQGAGTEGGDEPAANIHEAFLKGRLNTISVRVRDDGTYVCDGLKPGTYKLTCHPRVAREEVTVEVPEGRTLVEVDVDLKD